MAPGAIGKSQDRQTDRHLFILNTVVCTFPAGACGSWSGSVRVCPEVWPVPLAVLGERSCEEPLVDVAGSGQQLGVWVGDLRGRAWLVCGRRIRSPNTRWGPAVSSLLSQVRRAGGAWAGAERDVPGPKQLSLGLWPVNWLAGCLPACLLWAPGPAVLP